MRPAEVERFEHTAEQAVFEAGQCRPRIVTPPSTEPHDRAAVAYRSRPAFMAGGWLSGACYRRWLRSWRSTDCAACSPARLGNRPASVVCAAYFGVATESIINDSDLWRHGFLLFDLLWGLIAASRRYTTRATRALQPLAANRAALAHQERPAYRFF